MRWRTALTALAVLCGFVGCDAEPDDPAAAGFAATPAAEDAADGPNAVPGLDAALAPSPGAELRDVRGRLVDGRGRALGDARVAVRELISAFPRRLGETLDAAFTDRDGRFAVRAPAGRDLALEASADGCATTVFQVPHDAAEPVLSLADGFEVRGIVVDALNRPIVGAQVVMQPTLFEDRRGRSTTTDDRGRFRFGGVPAGLTAVVRLEARHGDLRPATLNNVLVASGEPVQLRLDSEPGPPLAGDVRRLDGQPVAGAIVEVFPSVAWNAQSMEPYVAHTDAEGSFQMRGLGRGNALVSVRHPDLSTVVRTVPVRAEAVDLRLEMIERVQVAGRLTGDLVPGLELVLTGRDGERLRAAVEDDGRFAFDRPASVGMSTLDIVGGRRAFSDSGERELSLEIEEGEAPVYEFELVAPARITGRVSDVEGRPVSGALVSAARYLQVRIPVRWTTVTGVDGGFSLDGLASGMATLRIEHPEYANHSTEVEVPAAGESLRVDDIRLVHGGSVTGRVTRDGQPVRGAVVIVSDQNSDGAVAVSGDDGVYVVRRLAPGGYGVYARYSTLPVRASPGAIGVVDDAVLEDVDFDFGDGRRIGGTVADERGQAIRDAYVFVLGVGAPPAVSEEDGRFTVDAPDREVRLQVMSPNGRVRSAPIAVPRDLDDVELVLPWIGRGVVQARVLGLPGPTPLADVIVRSTPRDRGAESDPDRDAQREVDAEPLQLVSGRLRWEDAPAGPSTLEIHAHGYVPHVVDVDLPIDGRIDLGTVRLEPGARLNGAVVDAAGAPVAGATVWVGRWQDLVAGAQGTTSDAEGRFTVAGIAPRSATVLIAKEGYTVVERSVRFPDDLLRAEPLRFVLREATRLEVIGLRGGQPIDEPRVIALMRDDRVLRVTLAGVAGKARFVCDLPGTYRIVEFGSEASGVTVVVTDEPQDLRVELELDSRE